MDFVMAVVQFPSGPREGLTDREVQAVVAWCARERHLEVTPIPATLKKGARSVSIFDNRGGLKWTVCRERGNLAVFDGDGKGVPRGTRAVESLWEALTRTTLAIG